MVSKKSEISTDKGKCKSQKEVQGLPVCEFSKCDESMIYVCSVNKHFGEVVQKLQNTCDTVVVAMTM